MSENNNIRILCMEDNPGHARLLTRKMEQLGYAVDLATTGDEGLSMYDPGIHDVLVMDLHMPVVNGLDVIRKLSNRGPLPPIIMISATGNERLAVEAMKLGANDYIVKDVDGGYLELLPAVIEQVIYQNQLEKAKLLADQQRDELICELEAFAHTVAHDLKNPLAVILGYSGILQTDFEALGDEETRDSIQQIYESANQMNGIIHELLLLAGVRKLDDIPMHQLNMRQHVNEAKGRIRLMIEEYQAEIELPPAWPVAMGYGPWIVEVWINYLSNALKYGGRPPRVALGATEQRDGTIRFWVRDNGTGLSPEDQSKLFVPFTRLQQVRAEGHGLGLSIVRRIVEKLKGEVGVDSQVGEGSTFYFVLPGKN